MPSPKAWPQPTWKTNSQRRYASKSRLQTSWMVGWCRQENGWMCTLPMETSFGHWNTSLLLQDENPIIGRFFVGNPNICFFRWLSNQEVNSSLNPPNSHNPNGGTYIQIGGLLKEK